MSMKTNNPTDEIIQVWKRQYGEVRRASIKGQDFYYRPLTRTEFRQLQSQLSGGKMTLDEMDDRIVEIALLSPDWSARDFDNLLAGVLTTLARKIRECSGFVDTEVQDVVLADDLPVFDVSQQDIEKWKEKEKHLSIVRVGKHRLLVRPLSRSDWNAVRKMDTGDPATSDMEAEICKIGLLEPSADEVVASLPAGYTIQISNAILQISGFVEEPVVEEVL